MTAGHIHDLMAKPDRLKPSFITHQDIDGLVAAILRLTMEVATLRDRLDVHEALAEQKGFGGEAEIEAFTPTPELTKKRMARRDHLIELMVRDLTTRIAPTA